MADENLKQQLQQISANDAKIDTDNLEIKGQVNALRQYGMGVTGIQRDRLGDVVYDLADGYGKGGGVYKETFLIDVDNRTVDRLSFRISDATKRNYLAAYAVCETGVYDSGSIAVDDVPTVPTGNNQPLIGIALLRDDPLWFDGIVGTSRNPMYMQGGEAVIRGAVSTYGTTANAVSAIRFEVDRGTGNASVRAQYNFGRTGAHIKYKIEIIGWD